MFICSTFAKYIVSHGKHVTESLLKHIPHTQHYVKEKYTEPCMNIRSQFWCWTNTKYECMYCSLFFFAEFTLYTHISSQNNEHWCNKNPHFFYVTLKCEFIGPIFFKYINSDCYVKLIRMLFFRELTQ